MNMHATSISGWETYYKDRVNHYIMLEYSLKQLNGFPERKLKIKCRGGKGGSIVYRKIGT